MFFLNTRSWTTTLRTLLAATPVLWLSALVPDAGAVPGQGTLYGTSGNPSSFGSVDPFTGVITEIGPTGAGAVPSLAVRSNMTVYGGGGAGNPTLYIIDSDTGLANDVGPAGMGGSIGGMDFDASGVLYGTLNLTGGGQTGSETLVTIEPGSGAAMVVGDLGSVEGIESLAFDENGVLWGAKTARGPAGLEGIYTINTSTGLATHQFALNPPPSGGLSSLQFACDGTLYGGTARALGGADDGGKLVSVDTSTGDVTIISAEGIENGTSMASLAFSIPNCNPPSNSNLYGCCRGSELDGENPDSCGTGNNSCENSAISYPPYIWPSTWPGANDWQTLLFDTDTQFTDLYYTAGPDAPDTSQVPCRMETTLAGDLTCGFEGLVNVTGGATITSFTPDDAVGLSASISDNDKQLRLVSSRATNPLAQGVHRLGRLELQVTDPVGVVVTTSGTVVGANGDGGNPAALEVRPISPLNIYVPEPSVWLQAPAALLGLAVLARLRRRRDD